MAAVRPCGGSFVIEGDPRSTWEQIIQEQVMTSRVQLALNVTDLEAATRRYSDLFGVAPAKTRPGYVNFAIDDPPLKLVLFENPGAAAAALNHLGVELASTDDVLAAGDRFTGKGLAHTVARNDRCCHAVQDKVWVDVADVPLGAWEFYTVLADDDTSVVDDIVDSACCAGDSAADVPCCGAPSAAGDA